MNKLLYLATFLLYGILVSCDDKPNGNHDCEFVQDDSTKDGLIDDTERIIMDDCIKNALTSKSKIENNLIGEWKLVGHGEGWLANKSQPCGYITISSTTLISEFKNKYTDTITTHQWEVIESMVNGKTYFKLKANPELGEGLHFNQFCRNYIFGDDTPSDGNMYLYEKVK
jgi:hypothetical protein